MKKLLFLGAMAALLLGTASCSNDMEPQMTDDGTVSFKVELPGAIDSRAIADGTTATKLEVACYDVNGNKLPVEPTVKTDFVNREATVTYKLVKGQTYNFSFFAHAPNAPYTFDPGTTLAGCKFTVDYAGACNDENRDAFYAVLKNYEVTATETTVTLYRPFAQLNFGADDLAAAQAAGIIPSQSKVTVKQAATEFNLSTGMAGGNLVDVEYTLADLPDAQVVDGVMTPATLSVDGTPYSWMEMCYFLVPNNEANVDVEMTVATNLSNVVVPVANVPVKKNHRTNIVGSLFTQDANFRIIIDQNFDVADFNIDYSAPVVPDGKAMVNGTEYNTLADAITAATNGETVYLGAGTYNEAVTVPANGNVSIHAGNGLSADDVTITQQVRAEAGSTLDMKNVSVTKTGAAAISVEGANVTLDGVEASGTRGISIEDGTTAVIKNSKFNGTGADAENYNRGVSVWGSNNNVTIEASEINAGWYAINVTAGDGNIINIENSTVNGWACFNIWNNNQTITANKCTLNSLNDKVYNADGWNTFAAIKLNNGTNHNTVNVKDSKVNVESTKGNKQYLILYGGTDHAVNAENVAIVGRTTNTNGYAVANTESDATCTLNFDDNCTIDWE